jgi:hypothetical protein
VRLSRHDRLQLELKVEHLVSERTKKALRSELDLWFYLPPATGIGPGDYDTDSFYKDLRVFTRLKSPTYPLHQLCDFGDLGAPMGRLYQRVRMLPDGTLPKKREGRLRRDCRLLVVAARTALRVDTDPEFDGDDSTPVVHSTQQLAELASLLLERFRTLRPMLENRDLRKRTRRCLSFADEYLSVLVEFAAVETMLQLESIGLHDSQARDSYEELRSLAQQEIKYREQNGWRSVHQPDPTDPLGRAAYLDQTSLLKKYFSSVLHLELEHDSRNSWAEHIALGLAAALAMAWAIGVQVFTFFALGLDLSQNMGSGLLMIFICIAVAAYILKDRIKATVGNALRRQIPEWLSDRRNDLYASRGDLVFGRIEERMRFVQTDEIPERVQEARLESVRNRLVAEAETDVLHYRRSLHLDPRKARREIDHFEGLCDIIRVNIWRWIRTFSGSKKPVQILDPEGRPTTVKVPNEYVVDVLYRYQIGSNEKKMRASTQVHKVRMFMNRRGILRVIAVDD